MKVRLYLLPLLFAALTILLAVSFPVTAADRDPSASENYSLQDTNHDGVSDLAQFASGPTTSTVQAAEAVSIGVVQTACSPVTVRDRLRALGHTVTLIPPSSDLNTFNSYDIIYLPTGWAQSGDTCAGDYQTIESRASQYHQYVHSGGALYVEQPNPFQQPQGTVRPSLLPYPITFHNWYARSDYPPQVIDANHFLTQGLPTEDLPFPADQMIAVDAAYRRLVVGPLTGSASLAVTEYGAGRVLVNTAHASKNAIHPFSDEAYARMIEWLAGDGAVGDCSIPYFSQRDPRWINHPLRTNNICSTYCNTIGACGCTLTSASMVFTYYGSNMQPPTLSDCMGNQACPFNWGAGAACGGDQVTFVSRTDFSYERLDRELNQNGRPVLVGMYRRDNRDDTHWVLVTEGSGNDPANYTMHDPWPLNGSNMKLSRLANDNVFAWMAVYSGQPTCGGASAPPSATGAPVSRDPALEQHPLQLAPSTEITGSVILYHMTEITLTVMVNAASPNADIQAMQLWMGDENNPPDEWMPYQGLGVLAWDPAYNTINARFRDTMSNVSSVVSDTLQPVYSPPPEPATAASLKNYLPLLQAQP